MRSFLIPGGPVLKQRQRVIAGRELFMEEKWKNIGKKLHENKRFLIPAAAAISV